MFFILYTYLLWVFNFYYILPLLYIFSYKIFKYIHVCLYFIQSGSLVTLLGVFSTKQHGRN